MSQNEGGKCVLIAVALIGAAGAIIAAIIQSGGDSSRVSQPTENPTIQKPQATSTEASKPQAPIASGISHEDRIDWGNFRNYFEIDGISFDPNGKVSERLRFIVTAKGDFPYTSFEIKPYNSDDVPSSERTLNFMQDRSRRGRDPWSKGEKAYVWVDLPYNFSKATVQN